MSDQHLADIRDRLHDLDMLPICSYWLAQQPGETLDDAVRCTKGVGSTIIRMHLTPVLEGARSTWGDRWGEMVAHARATLEREARKAGDVGLLVAIENHQDFGSEELVSMAEEAGDNVGVVLDTGNPFAVGEDPVAFTRRAAHRIRHVHLKDYRAQFTSEGYRLVRCAVGEGSVPFDEIAAILERRDPQLTASLEPGALEARHIRLFTREWWTGYPPRDAHELGTMIGRLRPRRLGDNDDCRTPWESLLSGAELVEYEMAQLRRSVDNIRAMGWL
jgi:sugar phosphate isomerase/epimerase